MASAHAIDEASAMRPEYTDFKDIALETNTSILALYEAHNHNIVLESGTTPPHHPIYNLLENKLKVLQEYIKTVLNKG